MCHTYQKRPSISRCRKQKQNIESTVSGTPAGLEVHIYCPRSLVKVLVKLSSNEFNLNDHVFLVNCPCKCHAKNIGS